MGQMRSQMQYMYSQKQTTKQSTYTTMANGHNNKTIQREMEKRNVLK